MTPPPPVADPNSKTQEQVQKQEEVPPPVKKEEEVPPSVKQEEEVLPQEKEEEVIPPPIEQNESFGMEEQEEHEQNREKGDFSEKAMLAAGGDHGGRQTGVDVVISRDEIERFSSPGM